MRELENAEKLPDFVKTALKQQVIKGEIRQPDLAQLVAHFFDLAGGERAVANLLFQEFNNAPEGSLTRQRILDMIFRGVRFANENEPVIENTGLLSEDDLENELNSLLNSATETSKDWGEAKTVHNDEPNGLDHAKKEEEIPGGAASRSEPG